MLTFGLIVFHLKSYASLMQLIATRKVAHNNMIVKLTNIVSVTKFLSAVIWPTYCRYGVKQYIIHQ